MFQRLNNMFMGEVQNPSSQEPEFIEKEDEEWILVDVIVDNCTPFSKEEAEIETPSSPDCTPIFSCTATSLECLADINESCFIQFEQYPLEESWFVTPPPCFTAGGLTTIKVETSPMENLLIEHPSMSVYAFPNPCHEEQQRSCGSEMLHKPSKARVDAQNEMGQHIRCYVSALAAHTNFLEQAKRFHPKQWSKGHNERSSLNRNRLRRQNLTRECHSRQIKQSGLFVRQPCQRQYNY
ncbi:tumor protein p53-inducible nuclear protein 1 isoform X1 [Ambystoma mexicanum]|uniref:tumor protein p53-inducible nuclear protein 1 isoform X1 n=1 Tax=Ambystoma mexicanum TaxID=8296 RepID=UPI0037E70F6C